MLPGKNKGGKIMPKGKTTELLFGTLAKAYSILIKALMIALMPCYHTIY